MRGNGNYRISQLFGILANREFGKILKDKVKQEAILCNLFHEDQTARYNLIMEALKIIVE